MPSFYFSLVTAGISWVIWCLTRNFFQRSPLDNIPGPRSPSFTRGNLGQLFHRDGWAFHDSLTTQYNSAVVRLTGFFGKRMLYVFDPAALHHVTVKEMEIYDKPEWSFDAINLTLGPGLFGVHGASHRRQRKMLNPVFSIKHMRELTPIFYEVAHRLGKGIDTQVGDDATTINILDWLSRTALELMGQGGLGCSLDSLDTGLPSSYGKAVKEFIPAFSGLSELQTLFKYIKYLGPAWFRSTLVDVLPIAKLKELKALVTKVEVESAKIMTEKKTALQAGDDKVAHQVGEGKDIMSILLRANMSASASEGLSNEELLGQMMNLIVAGTDTTSGSLCMMTEVMARHPDVQDKLRAEIIEAQERYGMDLPYDELVALPYMDAFCREILRLYPPVAFTSREAQKDMVMPVSQPIMGVDGTSMNEVAVPAGTTIVIAIRSSNINKTVWGEDSLEFKPERWMGSLPSSVTESRIPGVYSNLMTFHAGGRSCIGFKFSQLETKVVLSVLVPKFRFLLAKNANDIVWNLGTVAYPTIGKENSTPTFPVAIERIKA